MMNNDRDYGRLAFSYQERDRRPWRQLKLQVGSLERLGLQCADN
jgi:hypothetical protein